MSRGGQIRTDDFLLPKQALYQAELRPVRGGGPLAIPQPDARICCRNLKFTRHLDSCRLKSEAARHDRGARRPQSRDFPTRGKDPPNLTRVVPP